jgi:hypothetical protein
MMVKSYPPDTFGPYAPPLDDAQRLRPIVADVASRLRAQCAHLATDDFDSLVLAIARRKLRWRDQELRERRGHR